MRLHSRTILTSLAVLASMSVFAQSSPVSTVFLERFDPPSGPDSVITYHTDTAAATLWNDTNQLAVSSPNSYHAKINPFDSIIFRTDTFSTVGNIFVRLTFDQIAKVHFGQRAWLRASNDGGQTWTLIDASHYQGTSTQFPSLNYFNELSYPNSAATPYWGGVTMTGTGITPTNSWWVPETFDISNILGVGPSGTGNGYANCLIEFVLEYRIPSGTANPAGWYVDNVQVDAAPCELVPPIIKFTPPNVPPIGARYQSSITLGYRAIDHDSGMDSVVVHHRINGGAWQVSQLTAATGGSCPDSSQFSFTWSNLVVGDTIDWYSEAFDCACPNMTRYPDIATGQYHTFWIDPSPPLICGLTTVNSFPYVVSTYPWLEDFSSIDFIQGSGTGNSGTSHRGIFPQGNPTSGKNWQVSPNPMSNGFGWSIRQGQTGTLNTGPLGDHTTGGGKYVYLETSQGNAGNNSLLITPCLNLVGMNHAVVEFYYHKYGSHMGNLRVDIDTGSATPKWVNGVALISGQTQLNATADWDKALISLDPYLGEIIRIRFLGNKNNSSTNDRGDMAIDDIRVYEPDTVDMQMVSFDAPENGYCQYTSTEDVSVVIRSEGFLPISTIPLAFSVTNLTTGTTVIHRDTCYTTLNLGDTTLYTFTPKADLSAFTDYHIYAWAEAPGDVKADNDTIGELYILHEAPITGFPHIQTFDGAGWTAGDGSANNPGTIGTTDWEVAPPGNSGFFSWHVGQDLTPTPGTGPRWSRLRNQSNYLYTEGSIYSGLTAAQFRTSRCIDLSTLTYPVLSFWYHTHGADIDKLQVQVIPNGSNMWQNAPSGVMIGGDQTAERQNWKFKMIDLSNYAGTVVKIRILAKKAATGDLADIAIDDLMIYDRPQKDVGISLITSPANSTNLASPQNLVMKIRNYGRQAQSNIPVTYQINDLCTPTNTGTYTTTHAPSLAPGAEATITITTPPTYYQGQFEVKAWTTLNLDGLAANDTATKISSGKTQVSVPVPLQTFDNCPGDEIGLFTQGGAGTLELWEMGSPSKAGFNTTASGTNAWVTSLLDDYQESDGNILRTPQFIGFDTIVGTELRFKHRFAFSGSDGGIVEYYHNGNWVPLGNAAVGVGINWYGSTYGSPSVAALGNLPGFAGTTGGNWISSSIPLNVWNYNSNPIQLRFRAASGAGSSGSGWAIDDFEIYVPPQNSASPVDIKTLEYLIVPSDTTHLRVRIENTGAKLLDSCQVRFQVNSGTWSNWEWAVFRDNNGNKMPLVRGAKRWHDFDQVWVNQGAGSYTICVETRRPDNKLDDIPSDDSYCEVELTLDEITIDNMNDYCNDFEDASVAAWVPLHGSDKNLSHDWQFGTPNQTQISSAASGSNAWMTQLSSNYSSMTNSALHTPFFNLAPNTVYTVEFDHNMLSEQYHDGGSLDWSYDGGIHWYTLGNVLQSGLWYNTVHVTGLNLVRPGWSGTTNGWVTSKINFTVENPGKLVFRLRFGGDFTYENEGWAIDNFCIQVAPPGTTADVVEIGMDEQVIDGFFMGYIAPNPSDAEATLSFNTVRPMDMNIVVYNLFGQKLITDEVRGQVGHNAYTMDVSQWPNGVYTIVAEVEGQTITRKFIVQH